MLKNIRGSVLFVVCLLCSSTIVAENVHKGLTDGEIIAIYNQVNSERAGKSLYRGKESRDTNG